MDSGYLSGVGPVHLPPLWKLSIIHFFLDSHVLQYPQSELSAENCIKGTGYSENLGKVMKDLCGADTPGFQMDSKADQRTHMLPNIDDDMLFRALS